MRAAWVGGTAATLKPLDNALAASDTLHVDDTPVPVLARGTGKTKTGRLWVYVRDELGRIYLKGRDGDRANAILAAGYNFALLLRWLATLLRALLQALLSTLLCLPIPENLAQTPIADRSSRPTR